MTFNLGLAQTKHANDDPLVTARAYCEQAVASHVDLLVFPESLMTPFELSIDDFIAAAQEIDGAFASAMANLAREHELWILFSMNERVAGHAKPFNTAVLVDANGARRALYRKAHLFDSSTHSESSKMSAGDELFQVVETPFAKIGLGICYDLRFPELARCQALDGCELLLYPAAWVDGPQKAHQWKTLLCARAIENSIFVAGVSRADDGYIGESWVFGPDGSTIAQSAIKESTLTTASIDTGEIASVRANIPALDHRRPEMYTCLS